MSTPPGARHIPAWAPTYHPIQNPATADWGLTIKRTDYEKLLEGFTPRDMDDKWLCITDKPDPQGNTTVHWYRSWTDTEQFAINVETEGNDGAKFAKITWEKEVGSIEVPAEEAKESAVGLCRGFIGCELEKAPSTAE